MQETSTDNTPIASTSSNIQTTSKSETKQKKEKTNLNKHKQSEVINISQPLISIPSSIVANKLTQYAKQF